MAIYFLNAEFKYPKILVDEVTSTIENYINEAVSDLKIKGDFDVLVYPNHEWTKDTDGVDGHAMSGGVLQIRIDLRNTFRSIKTLLGSPLKATIFHECNHIARWQGPGYGWGLLEATISEGLATVYERSKTAPYVIPHSDYSDIENLLSFYHRRNKHEDLSYNHNVWFFGFDPKFPKFLGYKVGTYVVDEALKNSKGTSIVELTQKTAKEILRISNLEL